MEKEKQMKSFAVRLLFIANLIALCTAVEAVPVEHLSSPKGGADDVIESIKQWRFSEGLKLVVEDLKNGNSERAKLRLAKYLSLHKNNPRALSLAGLILFEERNYAVAEESFNRLLKQGIKTSEVYALAGVSAYMQGKQVVAERSLKEALSLNAEQVLALRYLARIEMERNDREEAIGYYRKILSTPPYKNSNFTKVHLNLADALVQTGHADKAISLLDVKDVPVELRLGHTLILAGAYVSTGNVDKGLSVLDAASVDEKQNFYLESEKVRILAQSGKIDKALKLTDTLIKKYPDARARLYFDRGLILAEQNKFRNAAESILQSAEFAEKDEQSVIAIRAAGFFTRAGDVRRAEDILRKATKNEPDNLTVKYELAALLSQTKGLKESVRILDEILSKDGNHFRAHYLRGVIAWNQKQIPKAFLHFNKVVNINPKFVEGWLALSEVEHVRSSDKKMQETLELGLKNNPGNPALRYQLASQAFSKGNNERALLLLKNFPENSSGYGDAQSLVVLVMVEQGKPAEEIKKTLDRAKIIVSDNVYLSDAEGYFLAHNGQSTKAVTILRKAAKKAEDDTVIYLHLSEALLIDGKKEGAKKALKKAITLGISSRNERLIVDKLKVRLQL